MYQTNGLRLRRWPQVCAGLDICSTEFEYFWPFYNSVIHQRTHTENGELEWVIFLLTARYWQFVQEGQRNRDEGPILLHDPSNHCRGRGSLKEPLNSLDWSILFTHKYSLSDLCPFRSITQYLRRGTRSNKVIHADILSIASKAQ
jgi:hypothetical protein